jgi:L-histidine N-alpha-methyltransferase
VRTAIVTAVRAGIGAAASSPATFAPGGEDDFARAAAIGLSDTPRWLPPRFLYDAQGSRLFERITEQPEYYLTRTEAGILARHAEEIRDLTGRATLVELGAGSAVKTDLLLAAYARRDGAARYVPVDVSESALRRAATRITCRHPGITVAGLHGRYEDAFSRFRAESPAMVLFLGSTVGNFTAVESLRFWTSVSRALRPGDWFLLGVDLVKDRATLEAAYDDAAGVSAAFALNLFERMNRELDAGVDVNDLTYLARWNADQRRIEMSARFGRAQTVRIAPLDLAVRIGAGESVMTEISRKFLLNDLVTSLGAFHLEAKRVFTDDRRWFAVLLLRRRAESLPGCSERRC